MKALWHLAYWPALLIVVLCLLINFITTFIHSLAQDVAEFSEKKLRAQRGRA